MSLFESDPARVLPAGRGVPWLRYVLAAAVFIAVPYAFFKMLGDSSRGKPGAGDGYAPPRTVVLVVLDGHSHNALMRYARAGEAMPHVRRLMKEAVVFEDHYAQSNGTNAAFASLLTGLYPRHHGVGSLRFAGRERLSSRAVTLAEEFQEAGFRTLASMALPQFDDRLSGFGQGFDVYAAPEIEAEEPALRCGQVLTAVDEAFSEALKSDRDVFSLFHFAEGRGPITAPVSFVTRFAARRLEPFRDALPEIDSALAILGSNPEEGLAAIEKALGRKRGTPAWRAFEGAREESEAAFLDSCIGELIVKLRAEDRYANALFAILGNTGEEMRGEADASTPFMAARLHVPLILRTPHAAKAKRANVPTAAIDLRPTILEAVGVPFEGYEGEATTEARVGQSLLPLLEERSADEELPRPHEAVFVEDVRLGRTAAIDRFWLVADGVETPAVWLEDGRIVHEVSNVPIATRNMLDQTRLLLEEFGQAQSTTLALVPGRDETLRVDLHLSDGLIDGADLTPGVQLDAMPTAYLRRPRARFGARFYAPDLLAAEASLVLSTNRRDASMEIKVTPQGGSSRKLDEGRIWVGDRPALHLALPRIIDPKAPRWPLSAEATGEGSYEPAEVALDQESGGWWKLSVQGSKLQGTSGERASVLVMRQLAGDSAKTPLEFEADTGVSAELVAGENGALWIEGETPFYVRLRKVANSEFALTAMIGGRRIHASDVRVGERRMQAGGKPHFLIPGWLPGILDTLEVDVAGRTSTLTTIAPGALRILRTSHFLYPPEGALLPDTPEVQSFVRRLGRWE